MAAWFPLNWLAPEDIKLSIRKYSNDPTTYHAYIPDGSKKGYLIYIGDETESRQDVRREAKKRLEDYCWKVNSANMEKHYSK